MSDGISTGLGKGVESRAHERADDEKTTLDQAERWATLLGAQLAATRAPVGVPCANTGATNGWRAGAGDMTPGGANPLPVQMAATDALGTSGQAGSATENRMIVRVDGGDLGEVALCVDRKDGAIRVTIGAADAAAEATLGVERSVLMQALQSHGITVDSVNVVRGSNFGTVPAQRSSATRSPHDTAEAESKDNESRERRKLSRKLNLIG
jgi:hypothetical protein